jgi:type I restriction enzyme S subunit
LENGKTGIVRDLRSDGGIGFGSTEFIVMRADRAGAAYAYCLARFDGFRRNAQAGMSGASGRQRAATDNVSAFQVGIPPAGDDVFRVFEETAWPMLELVGQLGRTNELLAAARDLLLPRLTSCDASIVASAPLEEVD